MESLLSLSEKGAAHVLSAGNNDQIQDGPEIPQNPF